MVLTKDNLDQLNEEAIDYIFYSEGGAMGDPGIVELLDNRNMKYKFSYVKREGLDLRTFFNHFPNMEKVFGRNSKWGKDYEETGFKWIHIGLGNHLFVRVNKYDEYVDYLVSKFIKELEDRGQTFKEEDMKGLREWIITEGTGGFTYGAWHQFAEENERRMAIIREEGLKRFKNNIKSGIYGLIVADALGLPVQFMSRKEVKDLQVKDMLGYMTFNMPPGTWSDDGSLTLALVDSLSGGLSYVDQMYKFQQWINQGKYTQYGQAFDIGNGTKTALSNYEKYMDPTQAGPSDFRSNGNGSLMRILPLAYWLYINFGSECMNNEDAYEIIHNTSALTHGHNISKIACGIYIAIACNLLDGMNLNQAIASGINKAKDFYINHPKYKSDFKVFDRLLDNDFKNLDEDQINSSGYVLYSLEAALWSLLNTDNYRDCVLKAINLGDDTDTIGAIAGGLAGIAYGIDSIPKEWIDEIAKKELINGLIDQYTKSLTSKKEVLYGAICGDVIGSSKERRGNRIKHKNFPLFREGNRFTDDTVMTIAIAQAFINGKSKDAIVQAMKTYGLRYPDAGYGGKFKHWFKEENPQPNNSLGNGSAMRVSPVGWIGKSLEEVNNLARISAEVSHNNPEGIRGACAIAAAIFLARTSKSKEEIKNYIQDNYFYDLCFTLDSIRDDYRFDGTCMGSVPQAIVSFLEGKDYEDVIRNAISLGGDADTLAAIAGSIAEAYYGVPKYIKNKTYTYLNADLLNVIKEFNGKFAS